MFGAHMLNPKSLEPPCSVAETIAGILSSFFLYLTLMASCCCCLFSALFFWAYAIHSNYHNNVLNDCSCGVLIIDWHFNDIELVSIRKKSLLHWSASALSA